ncbi:putative Ig domain-containing protein [Cognatishimia maritima]|uniref:Uncharacterized protein n=1 Tax=Cognatishimia maritima TaxID=870908 RepID=A0A1M5NAD3_9RHOB|nr:putative Ig domain-containing protein [Cognatishimia maritima]SHG85953.1 hypothetical protein SAMN04488044_1455 [Cognatishimia maritima]
MHVQTFDFQGGAENFDIRFPAGEGLRLALLNAPAGGVKVLTIGENPNLEPLIEVQGQSQFEVEADDLEAIPEGRLCRFNIWHSLGGEMDLIAEGRFLRRASLAPDLPASPFEVTEAAPILLMDGDSVMHNMPGTRVFLQQLVGHQFRFPEGFVHATGGDSARKIWFGTPEIVAQIVPDQTVVVMGPVGANQTLDDDSFEEITSFLDQTFTALLAAGAHVIAVPTLLDGMGITTQDAKKSALAAWVTAYETGGVVTYLGVDHSVAAHARFHAVDVGGFDRDTMKSDVSHPNAVGARYLAGQIADRLAGLVSADVFAAPEIDNLLGAASTFRTGVAASTNGVAGTVPQDWTVARTEGSDVWTCGYGVDNSFEVSVTDTQGDGTCTISLPGLAVDALAGDILNFVAEVEIAEAAVGLKSVGVVALGSSPMTLNTDWAAEAGRYNLRTPDAAYGADTAQQTVQVVIKVAAGASVTVKLHRATAFIAGNVANKFQISGTPSEGLVLGAAYSFVPQTSGGTAPFVFDLAGGVLPTGLALNAATGEISGVASEASLAEGLALRVRDSEGATAVLPYFAINVIGGDVPVNQLLPVIDTLSPSVGDVLTATTGSWSNSPTAYQYQWLSSGSEISGATAVSYEVQPQDVGQTLSVRVIAINASGSSSPAQSAATNAVVAASGGSASWDSNINTGAPLELAYSDADRQVSATADISGVRHTRGVTVLTGKVYLEFDLGPQVLGVGLATSGTTALNGGAFGTGRCFWSGSYVFHSAGNTAMGASLLDGDVVQLAVDLGTSEFWMRRNGAGDWNNDAAADPATGGGGLDISGMTGDIFAYAGLQNDSTASVTLQGTADRQSYGAPAGFAPLG